MNPFAKKPVAMESPKMPVQNMKSRFQSIRDDAVIARDAFARIAHTASTMIMDAEKGVNFANKWITDANQAIEEMGGESQPEIHGQIKEFVQKEYQRPAPEAPNG